MVEEAFRSSQVCRIVGCSYRQLDYWESTRVISPSVTMARGSGTQRRFSLDDIVALTLLKRLLDAGCSLQRLRPVLGDLRGRRFAGFVVFAAGEVFTVPSVEGLANVFEESCPAVLVVHMPSIIKLVSSLVEASTGFRAARVVEPPRAARKDIEVVS